MAEVIAAWPEFTRRFREREVSSVVLLDLGSLSHLSSKVQNRLYDPLTSKYVRSDNVQDNSSGMDLYASVGDNPETRNDPSGHCWPLGTTILGAVIGAAVSMAVTVVTHAVEHKPISVGDAVQSAVVETVSGAVAGLAGPEAGPCSAGRV